jgi:hypothetical protein
MATNPRSEVSERTNLELVSRRRRAKHPKTGSLTGRVISTVVALILLALVLRFMPVGSKSAQAHVPQATAQASPADLQFSDVQINRIITGEALFLDGLVTNTGKAKIKAVTAQVDFHDPQGNVIASLEKPLVGISKGGTDVVQNEFAGNPIKPNEMRFFRVEVKDVPPAWNHEVPELKIVAVTAR